MKQRACEGRIEYTDVLSRAETTRVSDSASSQANKHSRANLEGSVS